jgi:hypothetical protein
VKFYLIQQKTSASQGGEMNAKVYPFSGELNLPLNQIKPPADAFGGLTRKVALCATGRRRAIRLAAY